MESSIYLKKRTRRNLLKLKELDNLLVPVVKTLRDEPLT